MAPQRQTAEQQRQRQRAANSTAAGPAARTRAAVQQQQRRHQEHQQHAAEMALSLLLQHDSSRLQPQLVCSLLCCSKALAAVVAERCAGQLDIPLHPTAGVRPLAAWLRKHARLVRLLDLQQVRTKAERVIAAALSAAGPQTLQLQSLKVGNAVTTLPLLRQLPAHSLTRLDLWVEEWGVQQQDRPAFVARLSAALRRLTSLRSLALVRSFGVSLELPGLSGLTQLTSLVHKGPASDLQHLPPQLLELELQWYRQGPEPPLELDHLAAVTRMSCMGLREDDVLPANLQSLCVRGCRSMEPVLALPQLQELEIVSETERDGWTNITADQLRQLSRLSALSLGFADTASAAAWPLLPLQRLELHGVNLSATVCQSLAQLSGLTSLRLDVFQLPQAATAQQLAVVLRRLSGLQELQLASPDWPSVTDATTGQLVQGVRQLLQAIGSLQRLHSLDIHRFKPLAAIAAGRRDDSLAALTGVTSLSLAKCRLEDASLEAIVLQLPRLQSLDLGGNTWVTDDGLPAIGRLRQLTELSLALMQGVTDSGLKCLTRLVWLRKLNLAGTSVTDGGVRRLAKLTQLQELSVPGCGVSEQQLWWLQQQLPGLVCRRM